MLLKGFKIAVIMQKSVSFLKAKCRDHTVNRLPHRDSVCAQHAVILCGSYGESYPT